MAGIAFKLQKVLDKKDLTSLLKAYSYGAFLSAGGWIISIVTIFLVGFINIFLFSNSKDVIVYQVSLTYIIALSLIVSSIHHLSFTRFVADSLYDGKEKEIIPNFLGLFILNTVISLIFILIFEYFILKGVKSDYLIAFLFTFLLLSNVWILNILASSVKEFNYVTWVYFISYVIIIILSILAGNYGKDYLLLAFFLGNIILFFALLYLIVKHYDFEKVLSFDFLKAYKKYYELIFIGLFFNLGVWIDEFVFWYTPITSIPIIGDIRASLIYDIPVSLAYLSIIPGMAIFFIRLEVDFAILYEKYFTGVVEGDTLSALIYYKNDMIDVLRMAIKESVILQGVFNIFIYLFSKDIFSALNLPLSALPLFYIDLVVTQLQLLVMNMLAFLFYLDRRQEALIVSFLMFFGNLIFTIVSIKLGPYFYGYGTALAMLLSSVVAILFLRSVVKNLEYETFMLQK